MNNCIICGGKLRGKQKKYCSKGCYEKGKWQRRGIIRKDRATKFRLDCKKNKSCVICGYNEHIEILQFHHKERNNKDKRPIGHMFSLLRLKKEILKCELLCPNCHFWFHYKEKRKGTKN